MKKGLSIFAAFFLVAMLVGFVIHVRSRREPVYQGKRLSEWLAGTFQWTGTGYAMHLAGPVSDAVRQSGTNAIPTLLGLMSTRDYPLTVPLRKHGISFNNKTLADLGFFHPFIQRNRGLAGFQALGSRGKVAVPALLQVAKTNPSAGVEVAQAILAIGDEAIGPLTMMLTNNDPKIRKTATYLLSGSNFRNSASEITPFLIQNLSDKDASLRAYTARVLASFGSRASNAIPALLQLGHDGQSEVCQAAQAAVRRIEAAAKAEVR